MNQVIEENVNLSGEWIGLYPGHYQECVQITQTGDEVEALKITGDDYVPAGAITWRANLRTGDGVGQIAEQEFRNARFIPGRLEVLSAEKIVFKWQDYGEVEFRKDD